MNTLRLYTAFSCLFLFLSCVENEIEIFDVTIDIQPMIIQMVQFLLLSKVNPVKVRVLLRKVHWPMRPIQVRHSKTHLMVESAMLALDLTLQLQQMYAIK